MAPLCCQHLHHGEMGELQAKFDSHTRSIGDAVCMFRAHAEPIASFVEGVEGLVVQAKAKCCVCQQVVNLQQAGAPSTVQTFNRMRVNELVLANVILQNDGKHPLEVMQLRMITANQQTHEQLHRYQVNQYKKCVTGSVPMEIMTTPCKDVQELLATPRDRKRLKVQHTNEMIETK